MKKIIFLFLFKLSFVFANSPKILSEKINSFQSKINNHKNQYTSEFVLHSDKLLSEFSLDKKRNLKALRSNQRHLNALISILNNGQSRLVRTRDIISELISLHLNSLSNLTAFTRSVSAPINAIAAQRKVIQTKAVKKTKKRKLPEITFRVNEVASQDSAIMAAEDSVMNQSNNKNLVYKFVGMFFFFIMFLLILKFRKIFFRNEKKTNEQYELSSDDFFIDAPYPCIRLDENDSVVWVNEIARRTLNLKIQEQFNYKSLKVADDGSYIFYGCDSKKYLLIDNEQTKEFKSLLFVPIANFVENKSYQVTEDSTSVNDVLVEALVDLNYLFVGNSIPVCINNNADFVLQKQHNTIVKEMIYLSFLITKDCENSRLNIVTNDSDQIFSIEFEIRGITQETLDLKKHYGTVRGCSRSLQDVLCEVELKLAAYNGRSLIFNKGENQDNTLVLAFTFDKFSTNWYGQKLLSTNSSNIETI